MHHRDYSIDELIRDVIVPAGWEYGRYENEIWVIPFADHPDIELLLSMGYRGELEICDYCWLTIDKLDVEAFLEAVDLANKDINMQGRPKVIYHYDGKEGTVNFSTYNYINFDSRILYPEEYLAIAFKDTLDAAYTVLYQMRNLGKCKFEDRSRSPEPDFAAIDSYNRKANLESNGWLNRTIRKSLAELQCDVVFHSNAGPVPADVHAERKYYYIYQGGCFELSYFRGSRFIVVGQSLEGSFDSAVPEEHVCALHLTNEINKQFHGLTAAYQKYNGKMSIQVNACYYFMFAEDFTNFLSISMNVIFEARFKVFAEHRLLEMNKNKKDE